MSTILALEMVTKRFGGLTAVDQMSLKVEIGESVGLNWSQWCWKNNFIFFDNGRTSG